LKDGAGACYCAKTTAVLQKITAAKTEKRIRLLICMSSFELIEKVACPFSTKNERLAANHRQPFVSFK
jgi:hypothetical protein